MNVRCPHCHDSVDLIPEGPLNDIECPSCGTEFSLIDGETTVSCRSGETTTVGHFQLVEHLGVGAFGNVWKARDTELDRTVALKIPRKGGLSTAELDMFFREARAAAQLTHPNIVSVHEVGKDGETVYIVSDFIQGANLKDWLQVRPLSARGAAELCVKLGQALHYAHEHSIVHRDLKPANIMMDLEGEPHIMDFGLAKRDAGEITMTMEGQILGTPAYMSPEQARGQGHDADRRADVYSLGVILFELLAGEVPFRGEKRMLIVQILHDVPPSPRKLNSSVPRDLETICLKCLEKDADRRYETAADFAADLHRWLKHEPILARPVGWAGKTARWCKRKPVAALLLVVIVLWSLTSTFAWRMAVAAATNAQDAAQARGEIGRAHHKTFVLAADTALARGDVDSALDWYDRALADREDDRLELEVRRLRAWLPLDKSEMFESELDRLWDVRDQLAQSESATLLLLQGDRLLNRGDSAEGRKLIQNALDSNALSAADADYAAAVLVQPMGRSVELYREALAKAPFHYRAYLGLVTAETMVGRFHEASADANTMQSLFPADPSPTIALAWIELLEGKHDEALTRVESLRERLGKERAADVVSRFENLSAMLRIVQDRNPLTDLSPFEQVKLIGLLTSSVADHDKEPVLPLGWHSVDSALAAWAEAVKAVGQGLFSTDAAIARLERASKEYSEGFLRYLHGFFHLKLAMKHLADGAEQPLLADLRRAADLLYEAADSPSLIAWVNYSGLLYGAVSDSLLIRAQSEVSGSDVDPVVVKRIHEAVPRLLLGGRRHARHREEALSSIIGEFEPEIARTLLSDWSLDEPVNPKPARLRARLELRTKNYRAAIRWAEEVVRLAKDPKDEKMLELIKAANEGLAAERKVVP